MLFQTIMNRLRTDVILFRPFSFREIVNKPNVYKLKNFCGDCRASVVQGFHNAITDKGGWLVVQGRQD